MRVVVTGGFGFVGSHVVAALQRAGYDVIPCSRRTGLDLRDPQRSAEFFTRMKPALVVHGAAHVGGIAYNEHHAVEIFTDNLQISLSLASALQASGTTRLINVMPSCTYPGEKTLYTETEWWDGPIHPSVLSYGLSRKVLWGLTWAYGKQSELRALHLLLPNLYGPGDTCDPLRSHALAALIAKIVEAKRAAKPDVVVWGTGKPIREWLYVEDAAEAVRRSVQHFDRLSALQDGLLNIGTGRGVSVTHMAETIRKVVGWEGRLVYDTNRPDGAMVKLMDPTRMKAWLSWSPPTSFEEGVAKTVDWYRRHEESGSARRFVEVG